MNQDRITTYGRAEFELKQELNALAFSRCYVLGSALSEILEHGVFAYIGHHVGHGMCYEAAAAIMIALHDFPETRLVQATAYSARRNYYTGHAWVELHYHGRDLVFDPCWIKSSILPSQSPFGNVYFASRKEFYQITKPYRHAFIPHESFWQYDLSHYLREVFRQPHADLEQSVLLSCYRPPVENAVGFNSWVDDVAGNTARQQEAIRQFIQYRVWPNHLHDIIGLLGHYAG